MKFFKMSLFCTFWIVLSFMSVFFLLLTLLLFCFAAIGAATPTLLMLSLLLLLSFDLLLLNFLKLDNSSKFQKSLLYRLLKLSTSNLEKENILVKRRNHFKSAITHLKSDVNESTILNFCLVLEMSLFWSSVSNFIAGLGKYLGLKITVGFIQIFTNCHL